MNALYPSQHWRIWRMSFTFIISEMTRISITMPIDPFRQTRDQSRKHDDDLIQNILPFYPYACVILLALGKSCHASEATLTNMSD